MIAHLQNSVSPLMWGVLLGLMGSPVLAELPGHLLANVPSISMARGTVFQSTVTSDGRVLIQGDFTEVNGVARPSLAVLRNDGTLDTSFVPESVGLSGQPQTMTPFISPNTTGGLQVLTNGTWLHSLYGYTLAYRPDGTLAPDYGFLNDCDGAARILCETTTALYILRTASDGHRFEAYRKPDFQRVPLDEDLWPVPVMQAVPAANGGAWLLGREAGDPMSLIQPPWVLFRITASGELDAHFAPVSLRGDRGFLLKSRSCGGFRLIYWDESWYSMGYHVAMRHYVVDFHDAGGTLMMSRNVHLPFGTALLEAEEADGAWLYNVVEGEPWQRVQRIVRMRADGTPDPGFSVLLSAPMLAVLPDGRIQHSHLHRILPDGTPDPAWQVPALVADPTVAILGHFADGAVLLQRTGVPLDGTGHPLVALTPALEPDSTFQPAPDLPPAFSYHLAQDRQSILMVVQDIYEFPDNSRTRILRLLRDGSIDPDSPRHIPESGIILMQPDGTPEPAYLTGPFGLVPLPDGDMFIYYTAPYSVDVPNTVLYRLRPDGTRDPDFSFAGDSQWLQSPFMLADGRFMVRHELFSPDGSRIDIPPLPQFGAPMAELEPNRIVVRYFDNVGVQLGLFDFEHGMDPEFNTAFEEGTAIQQVLPLPDGTWIVSGSLVTAGGTQRLVRLYADGRIDPTFRPATLSRTLPWTEGLWSVVREGVLVSASFTHRARPVPPASMRVLPANSGLLVGGDFTHAGEEPRTGLALLSLQPVDTFSQWLEIFAAETPDQPEQQLGAYVQGVDPLAAPPRLARSETGMPGLWQLPVNPDATDMEIEWEVSTDLDQWRKALPGEIPVTVGAASLHPVLPQNDASFFLRARYRLVP
jgi:hypothetical protein